MYHLIPSFNGKQLGIIKRILRIYLKVFVTTEINYSRNS